MPELPEVQTVVTTIRPHVVDRTIRAVELNRVDIVDPAECDLAMLLTGRTIVSVDRRGKKIVFATDRADRFVIHLGMTGRLSFEPTDTPFRKHTHLVLLFETGQLRFVDPRRFGGIWWLGKDLNPGYRMGPEPLTLRPGRLARQLSKTTRAIKNALLDQSVIAGLGNIYIDESLHRAGIHPLAPADQLVDVQIKRLNRSIKSVLKSAIRHRGSTLRDYADGDGKPGEFQSRHRVYARAGQPCRACKSPIERFVLAARSTHFCPRCQPR